MPLSKPTPSSNTEDLQSAIADMDYVTRKGCAEIISLAKLAIVYISSADADPKHVRNVLRTIWSQAEFVRDAANGDAAGVGCQHEDEELMDVQSALYALSPVVREVGHA